MHVPQVTDEELLSLYPNSFVELDEHQKFKAQVFEKLGEDWRIHNLRSLHCAIYDDELHRLSPLDVHLEALKIRIRKKDE